MRKLTLKLFALLLCSPFIGHSQFTFNKLTTPGITTEFVKSTAMGGVITPSLQVMIVGYNNSSNAAAAKFYNTFSSTYGFSSLVQPSGITPLYDGHAVLHDFNNDGKKDYLAIGLSNSSTITSSYSRGTHTTYPYYNPVTSHPFPSVYKGSIAVGDVNGDGYPDVVITGRSSTVSALTRVYTNDGQGNFTLLNSTMKGASDGNVILADVDNDGDLDYIVSGNNYQNSTWVAHTTVYLNDGSGNPTELSNSGLHAQYGGCVKAADINGDGFVDLAIVGGTLIGTTHSNQEGKFYLNNGSGVFTLHATIASSYLRNALFEFADFDNDGDMDFVISGMQINSGNRLSFGMNDGSGNFTSINPIVSSSAGGITNGTLLVYDIDGDSRKDLIILGGNGTNGNTPVLSVLLNTTCNLTLPTLSSITSTCALTSLTAPTALDCDNNPYTATINGASPFPITQSSTVTWKFTKGTNTYLVDQDIIITDQDAPVPNNATLEPILSCAPLTSLTPPTATDACSYTVTHNATLPITSSTTITWTFKDANNNQTTADQTVTILSTELPVPTVSNLSAITATCEVTSLTAPTATHPCGNVTVSSDAIFPITNSTVVTWTYTGPGGQISTQTQDVIITGTVPPTPTESSLPTVSSTCQVSELIAPVATHPCGEVVATSDAQLPITSSTVITWTYTAPNGQTATQTQAIVIESHTNAPVPTEANLPDVTIPCNNSNFPAAPTALDYCGNTLTGVRSFVSLIDNQLTVLYTYTDNFGNTASQTRIITIETIINNTLNVTSPGVIESEESTEGCTYQWYDCTKDLPSGLITNQREFHAPYAGYFLVEISLNGCTIDSDCIYVDQASPSLNAQNVGLEELITIYPNPTNGQITVNFGETLKTGTIQVSDVSGRIIEVIHIDNQKVYTFELTGERGIYLITTQSEIGTATQTVVLQ